jgi:hypothetical protein
MNFNPSDSPAVERAFASQEVQQLWWRSMLLRAVHRLARAGIAFAIIASLAIGISKYEKSVPAPMMYETGSAHCLPTQDHQRGCQSVHQ